MTTFSDSSQANSPSPVSDEMSSNLDWWRPRLSYLGTMVGLFLVVEGGCLLSSMSSQLATWLYVVMIGVITGGAALAYYSQEFAKGRHVDKAVTFLLAMGVVLWGGILYSFDLSSLSQWEVISQLTPFRIANMAATNVLFLWVVFSSWIVFTQVGPLEMEREPMYLPTLLTDRRSLMYITAFLAGIAGLAVSLHYLVWIVQHSTTTTGREVFLITPSGILIYGVMGWKIFHHLLFLASCFLVVGTVVGLFQRPAGLAGIAAPAAGMMTVAFVVMVAVNLLGDHSHISSARRAGLALEIAVILPKVFSALVLVMGSLWLAQSLNHYGRSDGEPSESV